MLLQDLQSSNGTCLNGTRVQQSVCLSIGDQVRMGSSATLRVAASTVRPRPALQLEREDGAMVWPLRGDRTVIPAFPQTALVVEDDNAVYADGACSALPPPG